MVMVFAACCAVPNKYPTLSDLVLDMLAQVFTTRDPSLAATLPSGTENTGNAAKGEVSSQIGLSLTTLRPLNREHQDKVISMRCLLRVPD